MTDSSQDLIKIENVSVEYTRRRSIFSRPETIKAVDSVSLTVARGETLGLVGESGCGKSTLGRAVLNFTSPSSGRVLHNGDDLALLSSDGMRRRRRHLQMIFQDPYSSLNPKMTAGQIIHEPLKALGIPSRAAGQVAALMETVGLDPRLIDRRPREFSGGQRQRIGIARALAVEPQFIVADEPISALDVSIQAQIINLLRRLQSEKGLAYLFISHDLRAVRHIADRIAVMYLGRIVEIGEARAVFASPLMPYTRALMACVPVADPLVERRRERMPSLGELPTSAGEVSGCSFSSRCEFAIAKCRETVPQLTEIQPGHFAACIRIDPTRPSIERNAADQVDLSSK